MKTTLFESHLLESFELNRITGWFGEFGLSFDNLQTAERCADAFGTIQDVTILAGWRNPNKYGVYMVWIEPKTAIAAALVHCLCSSFTQI